MEESQSETFWKEIVSMRCYGSIIGRESIRGQQKRILILVTDIASAKVKLGKNLYITLGFCQLSFRTILMMFIQANWCALNSPKELN